MDVDDDHHHGKDLDDDADDALDFEFENEDAFEALREAERAAASFHDDPLNSDPMDLDANMRRQAPNTHDVFDGKGLATTTDGHRRRSSWVARNNQLRDDCFSSSPPTGSSPSHRQDHHHQVPVPSDWNIYDKRRQSPAATAAAAAKSDKHSFDSNSDDDEELLAMPSQESNDDNDNGPQKAKGPMQETQRTENDSQSQINSRSQALNDALNMEAFRRAAVGVHPAESTPLPLSMESQPLGHTQEMNDELNMRAFQRAGVVHDKQPELGSAKKRKKTDNVFADSDDDDSDEEDPNSARRQEIREGKRRIIDPEPSRPSMISAPVSQLKPTPLSLSDDDDDDELLHIPTHPLSPFEPEPAAVDELVELDPRISTLPSELPKRAPSSRSSADIRARRQLAHLARTFKVQADIRRTIGKGKVETLKHVVARDYTIFNADGPRGGGVFAALTSDRTRLYIPCRPAAAMTVDLDGESVWRHDDGSRRRLLAEDIHSMMREIEAERFLAAQERSAREFIEERIMREEGGGFDGIGDLGDRMDAFGEHDVDESEPVAMRNARRRRRLVAVDGVTGDNEREALWVDKYRPRAYIDLVGDEYVNREVLSWVKQWDFCVFRKAVKTSKLPEKYPNYQKNKMTTDKPQDILKRPERRICLLTGPPGLGKTTLAHIVGKHCGYNVIEINASDDRTGDVVKNKILNAIESRSIKTGKPNMLVIDEIDGASGSGQGDNNIIKLLVDLATGELKRGTVDGENAPATTKKKAKTRSLLRPILCICNDQYSPVLRPLRAVAQIFTFKEQHPRVLSARITQIASWEGMRIDLRAIMSLTEMTSGDLRACLNTLQLLRSRTNHVTSELLEDSREMVGAKDDRMGLFEVLDEVFNVGAERRKSIRGESENRYNARSGASVGGISGYVNGSDKRKYIGRLSSIISTSAEQDKVLQACHENYLKMKVLDMMSGTDRHGSKVEQALDWLIFSDQMGSNIISGGASSNSSNTRSNGELLKYVPHSIISFHRLFATTAKTKFDLPKAEYENFVARRASEGLLGTFITGLTPTARSRWGHKSQVVKELIHQLVTIISPDFRAVNIQLLKPAERAVLNNIVDTMVSFGLRFVQDKGEDGQYRYRLEPPIDNFKVVWDSSVQVQQRMMHVSYPVRQLIAKEIDTEIIRRADMASMQRVSSGKGIFGEKKQEVPPRSEAVDGKKVTMPPLHTAKSLSAFVADDTSNQDEMDEDEMPVMAPAPGAAKRGAANRAAATSIPLSQVSAKALVARDFFGRPIVLTEKEEELKAAAASAKKEGKPYRIKLTHNDGFSNAVRKPMKMKDVLGY